LTLFSEFEARDLLLNSEQLCSNGSAGNAASKEEMLDSRPSSVCSQPKGSSRRASNGIKARPVVAPAAPAAPPLVMGLMDDEFSDSSGATYHEFSAAVPFTSYSEDTAFLGSYDFNHHPPQHHHSQQTYEVNIIKSTIVMLFLIDFNCNDRVLFCNNI